MSTPFAHSSLIIPIQNVRTFNVYCLIFYCNDKSIGNNFVEIMKFAIVTCLFIVIIATNHTDYDYYHNRLQRILY